jgi:hypothetical protein
MNRVSALLLVVPVALVITSCGKDGGAGPDDPGRPTVESVDPVDGATDVSLVKPISITFSEALDASTVNDTTIYVVARAPSYHVQYDETSQTAVITPDTLHESEAWYSAVVTDGVTDPDGDTAVPHSTTFRTGPMDCAHLTDAMEPNEEIAEAAPVEVGGYYHSLTVCSDDRDTYEFSLGDPTKVTFATHIKYSPSDTTGHGPGWQIQFMRTDDEYYATLGTGAPAGHTRSFFHTFLPGTYHCEIYSSYGLEPNDYVLYDLSVSGSEPCQDDPYEDNDFPDEAALISEGLHTGLSGCHLDTDWFSIEMVAGQTMTVTVDATIPPGAWENRRLTVSAPGGDSSSYEGLDNPSTAQATALEDGTAHIHLLFWVDGVTYSLDVNLSD